MKKNFYVGALVSLMSIPMVVNAAGVSTVKFEGNTNVNVGDEFTVNMVFDNINGTNNGIVGFGGYINFDNSVLELVSTSQGDTYEVLINRKNNKIIGIDYTLANGIKERTNAYRMTFKAIKEGNSNVTLVNGEVEDTKNSVDFNVESLNIDVNKVVENHVNTNSTVEPTYVENDTVVEDTKVEDIKNAISKFFKRG